MSNLLKSRVHFIDELPVSNNILVYEGAFVYEILALAEIIDKLNKVRYVVRSVDPTTGKPISAIKRVGFDLWKSVDLKHQIQTYIHVDNAIELVRRQLYYVLNNFSNSDRKDDGVLTTDLLEEVVEKHVGKDGICEIVDMWLEEKFLV